MNQVREKKLPFLIFCAIVHFLPFLGKGGVLASAIIAAALVGAPLFVLIGIATLGMDAVHHGLGVDAYGRTMEGRAPQAEVLEPGFKYNLTDIAAALGMEQLSALEARHAGSLDDVMACAADDPDAIGESAADAFDLEFGF